MDEDRRAAKIMNECSDEAWIAPEGVTQTAAMFLIDMKCPMKLQEVQLRNSVEEFGTKMFSVFGSHNSAGPWELLYTGGLEEGRDEVSNMFLQLLSISFVLQQECCNIASHSAENCSLSSFPIPIEKSFSFEKQRFFKFQVDSFYGKGGGVQFLKLKGTRSGL